MAVLFACGSFVELRFLSNYWKSSLHVWFLDLFITTFFFYKIYTFLFYSYSYPAHWYLIFLKTQSCSIGMKSLSDIDCVIIVFSIPLVNYFPLTVCQTGNNLTIWPCCQNFLLRSKCVCRSRKGSSTIVCLATVKGWFVCYECLFTTTMLWHVCVEDDVVYLLFFSPLCF